MQKLNLISKAHSSIDYIIYTFPDGEKQINILSELNHKESVQIICRITNGDDLLLVLQVTDILTAHGMDFVLDIKYLLSARTDRRFTMNRPYSFKIICDILNTIKCPKYILDIHNPNKLSLLTGEVIEYQAGYNILLDVISADVICYPDLGAQVRYTKLLTSKYSIVYGEKVRGITGEITGLKLSETDDIFDKNVVVMDDLCDGGKTFIEVAKNLDKYHPKSKTLIITHAIQKVGLLNVSQFYDKVYITNSYADFEDLPKNIKIVNVTSYFLNYGSD